MTTTSAGYCGVALLALSVASFAAHDGGRVAVMYLVMGAISLVAAIAAPGPSAGRAVIEAVRVAPEQITAIRQLRSSRSGTVLLTTASAHGMFRTAKPDSLLVALARRCPRAKLR